MVDQPDVQICGTGYYKEGGIVRFDVEGVLYCCNSVIFPCSFLDTFQILKARIFQLENFNKHLLSLM